MKALAYMVYNMDSNETTFLDGNKRRIQESDYCKILRKHKETRCKFRNYKNMSITKVYSA
jgi:hypothetical protein